VYPINITPHKGELMSENLEKIRNIAIIAHVDHGKTTLVDQLLRKSGTLNQKNDSVRIMDSNDIEKERGITILSKNTAIKWQEYHINIIDTPGHADFGGEVERVLSMVDAVLLVVDAVEGPMPQTRFVTQKAFEANLIPIVVVNKIDRPESRPDWVIDQLFGLFDKLGANEQQLDFPVVYTSATKGLCGSSPEDLNENMDDLLEMIIEKVSPPQGDPKKPFQMQTTSLEYSSFVGAIAVGRITQGSIVKNTPVKIVDKDGNIRQERILQIFGFLGLEKQEKDSAHAGEIIAVTGISKPRISDTICDFDNPQALPALNVDEPTVQMSLLVNDSPFVGREGKLVTSRNIRERLDKELLTNVALHVEDTDTPDRFLIKGRGELHLSILLETMRREGFEFAIAKPEVIMKTIDSKVNEPYENLQVEVEQKHQGSIVEYLNSRKGELKEMSIDEQERVRLNYHIPTRGLIGFRQRFLTLTAGTGTCSHSFSHYAPTKGELRNQRSNGAIISNSTGSATAYSIFNLQPRGRINILPQAEIYEGMIIGVHSREEDIVVNAIKPKKLTNVRASGKDKKIILTPPEPMNLEKAIDFINEDELVEITPKSIRFRKRNLKENMRSSSRSKK
jgi:GTP-binding protein